MEEHLFQSILIAFDSSKASRVALQKACDIASKFNSRLTALFIESDKNVSFDDAVVYLENFTASKGLSCQIIKGKDNVCVEIDRIKEKTDFDLIIMTIVKENCRRKLGFGSNMLGLLHRSTCPILSIPSDEEEFSLNSILLPMADSPLTRQKVPFVSALAKAFGSTIHIYGVSRFSSDDTKERIHTYVRQTERYLSERNLKYTVYFDFGVNVPEANMAYAKKVKADVIIKGIRSEDQGVFRRNYLNQLIREGSVPIFSVPTSKALPQTSVS